MEDKIAPKRILKLWDAQCLSVHVINFSWIISFENKLYSKHFTIWQLCLDYSQSRQNYIKFLQLMASGQTGQTGLTALSHVVEDFRYLSLQVPRPI
jgi:hypothetical protein